MAWLPRIRRRRKRAAQPRTLRRRFITPEGVDLGLELGGAGARAAAFALDWLILVVVMVLATVAAVYLADESKSDVLEILWLLGLFLLRNGWFILWEMGSRAATPGKRALGLRVVARDGGRLTAGAVLVRNAMRELEVFLPLSFLAAQAAEGAADAFLVIFALLWSGIFLFFPITNRDRLRVGDLLGGTWVVRTARVKLAADLAAPAERMAGRQRHFSDAALDLYGIYELQTLEEVLRRGQEDAIATVAGTIRRKAGLPDDRDDPGFLADYYAALCARLERGMMLGQRREDKHRRGRSVTAAEPRNATAVDRTIKGEAGT